MTDGPGWRAPGPPEGAPDGPPPHGPRPDEGRPPLSSSWASDQPPAQEWGQRGAPEPAWSPPKPGVIPLRPLGVGEILDGAISTIRAKPRVMLGLSALVAVATQLVTVPLEWLLLHDVGSDATATFDSRSGAASGFPASAGAVSTLVVQVVVTLVATLLLTGILTVALSRAVLGQPIDTREAWEQARPRLPALLGVTLLVPLIGLAAAVVTLGPGVVLAVAGAPGVAVVVAFGLGVPVLLCLGGYLYVAFALAPAAVVLERAPVLVSLGRSRRLVSGAWWRTFGILALVNIIAQVVTGVLSGIFTVAAFVASGTSTGFRDFQPYDLLPLVIGALGHIVAATVTWPFTAVASALIYVDRRMRREALDLDLARAAGVAPPGQAATPGAPPAPYGG